MHAIKNAREQSLLTEGIRGLASLVITNGIYSSFTRLSRIVRISRAPSVSICS